MRRCSAVIVGVLRRTRARTYFLISARASGCSTSVVSQAPSRSISPGTSRRAKWSERTGLWPPFKRRRDSARRVRHRAPQSGRGQWGSGHRPQARLRTASQRGTIASNAERRRGSRRPAANSRPATSMVELTKRIAVSSGVSTVSRMSDANAFAASLFLRRARSAMDGSCLA